MSDEMFDRTVHVTGQLQQIRNSLLHSAIDGELHSAIVLLRQLQARADIAQQKDDEVKRLTEILNCYIAIDRRLAEALGEMTTYDGPMNITLGFKLAFAREVLAAWKAVQK